MLRRLEPGYFRRFGWDRFLLNGCLLDKWREVASKEDESVGNGVVSVQC